MRYKPGHKEQSRERILKAVGEGFRVAGYGGIGVDGLAEAAGVTSGAFYGHFRSKKAAFAAVVASGLKELRDGVAAIQAEHPGEGWVKAFAEFYLGDKRICPLRHSCALPSFSAEVERASKDVREAYAEGLTEVLELIAVRLPGVKGEVARQKAWALLSVLVGGLVLARAMPGKSGDAVARGVVSAAVELTKP